MKNLSLIDTHCDTSFELYHRKQHICENNCHISLKNAEYLENYTQFFAVWADKRKSDDECFSDFLAISDNLFAEIDASRDKIAFVKNFSEMENAWKSGRRAAFLAVEDARILGGRIERLYELERRGVKYLTLLWGGETCIGGSHNTDNGLTDFGKALARRCFELGLIPDVSHASEQSVDDLIPIAYQYGKPFIATHSNAHNLYGHSRNLRDRHFAVIKELGGIVGVSLCPSHLTDTTLRPATAEDVFAHVDYYLSLGGEDIVGFGADWDGTDLPVGFSGVNDLTCVAEIMARHNYSEELIHKLYWKNFYNFAIKNL